MRKFTLIIILFFVCFQGQGQVTEIPENTTVEQQLENITENNEDMETEDDSYLQELAQYQRNPINLNTVDAGTLKEFRLLSPLQIQNLISYRNILGKFISLYEIQSIPGWDIATIQRIRPYISVNTNMGLSDALSTRLKDGDHSLLFRVSQTLEKSKGYLVDPTTVKNYYPGSPQRLFLRYKYNYKNQLQYGVVAEKDGGEEFFKGSNKQGFDFYSAHFFMRNVGMVKSLALGDFTVNLGQGLTQWMSLAFKKGPDVSGIKRQASVLRPYNSAGEINFHRGAGITVGKKNWEATVFASYKKIDANFNGADSTSGMDEFVSSLQTSGLHRTQSEIEDKNIQRQLAFGGNISYQLKNLHLGVNAVQYDFKLPLSKQADSYNLYALSGSQFGNYSVDYSYTFRNMHFFGEAATTNKGYLAFLNGLLISVANNVDMSFVHRDISKGYQSLYSSAFTESTYPTNEKGFFGGVTIRANNNWKIDAYADMYKFPWLRYRVNSPTTGSDYLVQVTYKPNRIFEIYSRFKTESKAINYNPYEVPLHPVVPQGRQNWRTQLSYKLNPTFTLRTRAEITWFDKKSMKAENGYLMYADILYKPMMKPLSGNIRLQYFETDDYNSRLYAYESDVLYSFSIPMFYGKGYRYYVNLNYDIGKKVSFWAKWAQTIYPNQESVGTGLDEIKKNHKTDVKLQVMYRF